MTSATRAESRESLDSLVIGIEKSVKKKDCVACVGLPVCWPDSANDMKGLLLEESDSHEKVVKYNEYERNRH